MTTAEFRLEFDSLYDNITSGSAPGLDDYDRSYFLSKAQDEKVKSLYKIFESDERSRRVLNNLVLFHTTSTDITDSSGINTESQMFEIPATTQYIVAESVITDSDLTIRVKPTTHDELSSVLDDPFRKPSVDNIEKYALRLDRGDVSSTKVIELILFGDDVKTYSCRYIKKPVPIVLSDLTAIQNGISIEGITAETQCELDSSIHREIIDRAVELALEAFEQQRLQTKVQLNKNK